jgi:hypothetical protein
MAFKKTAKRVYKCILDFNFATTKLLKSLYPSTYCCCGWLDDVCVERAIYGFLLQVVNYHPLITLR